VVEAASGLDALSLLRTEEIDVALIDVMLPGIDGLELVRRIRAESEVPIILITARGEETSRVAGLEVGADDYVVKPFFPREVVARVRAQLRRSRGMTDQGAVGGRHNLRSIMMIMSTCLHIARFQGRHNVCDRRRVRASSDRHNVCDRRRVRASSDSARRKHGGPNPRGFVATMLKRSGSEKLEQAFHDRLRRCGA
jgi:DNA-binding response OmpR family regulator